MNKNSSELSLFATAPFAALKKILVLCYKHKIYFEKPNPQILFLQRVVKEKT